MSAAGPAPVARASEVQGAMGEGNQEFNMSNIATGDSARSRFTWEDLRAVLPIPPPWFWRDVALPFAATRLMLALIGVVAVSLLPMASGHGLWQFSQSPWINIWSRWDAGWYLSIARDGYSYVPGARCSANFSPLYPALMALVGALFGVTDRQGQLVIGIVLANAALLVAASLLWKLVELDFSRRTAARTVRYLFLYPSSFFLSAVYPESLFLALAVGSFYSARTRRWPQAALLAGLASLARPHGVVLMLPLAYECLAQHEWAWRRALPKVAWLLLTPVLFLIWPAYLHSISGDWLAFLKTQAAWGRATKPPWEVLADFLSAPLVMHAPDHSLIDLAFTAFLAIATIVAWRRLRQSYAVLMGVFLLVTISSGSLSAMMRYSLEMFPAMIVLALLGRKRLFEQMYVSVAAALGAIFMILFALWRFVA